MDNSHIIEITQRYEKIDLILTELLIESESQEYKACRFKLNELQIISRKAKITPKKVGQFVTCWHRNTEGITEPFHYTNLFDFYIIDASKENRKAVFVFPKDVLIKKGIVSTDQKDGKRGFRVYPIWDTTINKQAIKTQKWQLEYFYEFKEIKNLDGLKALFTD